MTLGDVIGLLVSLTFMAWMDIFFDPHEATCGKQHVHKYKVSMQKKVKG